MYMRRAPLARHRSTSGVWRFRRPTALLSVITVVAAFLTVVLGVVAGPANAVPAGSEYPATWTITGNVATGITASGVTVTATLTGPATFAAAGSLVVTGSKPSYFPATTTQALRINVVNCTNTAVDGCGSLTYAFSRPVKTPVLYTGDVGGGTANTGSTQFTAYHNSPQTVVGGTFSLDAAGTQTSQMAISNGGTTIGIANPAALIGAGGYSANSCAVPGFGCGVYDIAITPPTITSLTFTFGYAGTGTSSDSFTQVLGVTPVPGQSWTCSSYGYLFQTPGDGSHSITAVDLATGATTPAGSTADGVNAVGYNTLDNYMYGWNSTIGAVVQISADGSLISLGDPTGTGGPFNTGDFDNAGHLFLTQQNNISLNWHEVDLAPGSANYGKVIKSGSFTQPTGLSSGADWAWANGFLYMLELPTTGAKVPSLIRFNPANGVVTNLGSIGLTVPGSFTGTANIFGATYADAAGNIYAAYNGGGQIYRINPANPSSAILATNGPASSGNDGARCSSAPIPTITVTKQVAGRVQATDQFTVGLRTAAGPVLTSATTTGTAISVSTTNWPVSQGAAYTITDAMATGSPNTLSAYTATIACTDKGGNAVSTGGSSPSWTVTVADATDYTCTVTNTPTPPPPWACDAYGYLFQSPNGTTHRINRVDLVTGAAPVVGTTAMAVNGVDYNPLDNYIYGTGTSGASSQLVRIASDGTVTAVGTVPGTGYAMGGFDATGHLWEGNQSLNTWAEYDLVPGSATFGKQLTSGTFTAPGGISFVGGDWSWINGSLYSVGNTATRVPHLLEFNTSTHALTDRGVITMIAPVTAGQGVGATFTDGTYLYASDNESGFIYRIDPTTRETIKIANGPASTANDGARCAAAPIPTITVTKQVAGRVQADDQFVVGLATSGGTALTSATTSNTATSVSTTNWPVSQGTTYTITDAMAAGSPDALSAYTASIACTNKAGDTVSAGGSSPSWTLTVADATDYTCTITNTPATASYTVTKTASTAKAHPGDTVTYQVTVANTGSVPYTAASPASFTDDLSSVLDDATYTTASTTGGTVSYTAPTLGWSGPLPVNGTVTVTYSVRVNDPDVGDGHLDNTVVTPPDSGGNCPAGSSDPACVVNVAVQSFTVTKVSSASTAQPGDTMTYTITITNTGVLDYTSADPAAFTDNLVSVLDDATYNDDAAATGGTATYHAPTLSWTGPLAVGAPVLLTYSVTINNPDIGDATLDNTVVTPPGSGGNCPVGSTDAACSSTVPVQSFRVVKSTTATAVTPGGTVNYTITVTNTGALAYTTADPASFSDDLTAVLDDAAYNNDAVTTGGTVNYDNPTLSWSGALAVGATVTVTYSVAVDNPDTGDQDLDNTVVTPPGKGGNCPSGSTDPACSARVPAQSFTVAKSVSVLATNPGDTVTYTITVTNTGSADYPSEAPASFTDDLTGVLDDGIYNNDAVTTGGTVGYAEPALSWSGALAIGASVTITYTVTVHDPDTGDGRLLNTVSSPPDSGGNCVPGSTDPACVTDTPVRGFTVTKTANQATATPGQKLTYTVTVTNTGQAPYTSDVLASFTDDLTNVLDDASYNNDAVTTGGTVDYDDPTLSWSGELPLHGTVTVTYSVTVHDPDIGDQHLDNTVVTPPGSGGNCQSGSVDPACTRDVPVQTFRVTKVADQTVTRPGQNLTYTVTVTNTGQAPYTADAPARFADDLSSVLDDASYNNDEAATGGTVGYTKPTLSWSGALPVGGTVTITYSVRVNDPDTGDHQLVNTVVTPPGSGGGCPAGSTDLNCTWRVSVQSFAVLKTASQSIAVPGDTITYTVVVTNTGVVDYLAGSPASFTDDLSAVIDDADYNNDQAASAGSVSYLAPVLTWSGALAVTDTVTITYTVTVNGPGVGNNALNNTVVTPPGSGGNCPSGSVDPACSREVLLQSYRITKVGLPSPARPGDTVTYTITVVNTGAVAYTVGLPASFADDLSSVLDDATYAGDVSATSGTVGYEAPVLSWSGALPVNATVTISYSVLVNTPGDSESDSLLTNTVVTPPGSGGSCPAGSSDPMCTSAVPVQSFMVAKTVSATTVVPGDTLTYTVTVTNTGLVPYTSVDPARFTDSLVSVLDDASYVDDASASAGTVSYLEPTLSWFGPLAVGSSVTVTYSVQVNAPSSGGGDEDGDSVLDNTVVTPPGSGGNCPAGSADLACTKGVAVQSFSVAKVASPSVPARPGGIVTYTVTVINTGAVDYPVGSPASFTDDLSSVLDDATYGGDEIATSGIVGYLAPTLSWSGALPVAATVTVSYSVQVNDPKTGNSLLHNDVVTPPGSGGNCPTGSGDPICTSDVPVQSFTVTKLASATTALPGDTITYTITVTNTGAVDYAAAAPASVTDNLGAVIDDATYNDDEVATAGTVSYAAPVLTWSGALPIGGPVTITYSVTVNDPDTGNHKLDNAVVTPPGSGGNCLAGSTDALCVTETLVQSFSVVKTVDRTKVTPGEQVTYTVTVTNTGKVDYTTGNPASFTDDLSSVLDDATYNDDADASAGDASYLDPTLSWSGALAVNGTVTVIYSVTVNTPDDGDQKLNNTVVTPPGSGGNCPTGSTNPQCIAQVPGAQLRVEKTASTSIVMPGQQVTYTIVVTNTGQVDFTATDPASFTDDLSKVLDDATYDGNASSGATVSGKTLSWSGPLAVDDTVTVTYSVTVNSPANGDRLLHNTVTLPPGLNSNCSAGSTDPACSTVTPVKDYQVRKTVSSAKATSGGTLVYTITVLNTGQVEFPTDGPASFVDDMSKVLDDADYDNNAQASAGTTSYSSPRLSWSGPLPIAGTVTVTYSVTVSDPHHGDGKLHNVVTTPTNPNGVSVGNCPSGAASAACFADAVVEAVTVTASNPSTPLAVTGSDSRLQLILAGLLLAAGGLLLAGVRRRRLTLS